MVFPRKFHSGASEEVISAGTKWARQEVEESSCAPNKHKDFFFQKFELEHKD